MAMLHVHCALKKLMQYCINLFTFFIISFGGYCLWSVPLISTSKGIALLWKKSWLSTKSFLFASLSELHTISFTSNLLWELSCMCCPLSKWGFFTACAPFFSVKLHALYLKAFPWFSVMELCFALSLSAFDMQFELPKFPFLLSTVFGFVFRLLASNSLFWTLLLFNPK